jgi:hypothetical protein
LLECDPTVCLPEKSKVTRGLAEGDLTFRGETNRRVTLGIGNDWMMVVTLWIGNDWDKDWVKVVTLGIGNDCDKVWVKIE